MLYNSLEIEKTEFPEGSCSILREASPNATITHKWQILNTTLVDTAKHQIGQGPAQQNGRCWGREVIDCKAKYSKFIISIGG